MKDHEYWQERISCLLDGELSPEEEAALWEHIEQCPDCAQVYETYEQMTAVLRSEAALPPAELSRLVMARIEAGGAAVSRQPAEQPGKRSAAVHRLRPWKKVAAAACFVALVAVGAVTGLYGRSSKLAGSANESAARIDYLPEAKNDTVYGAGQASQDALARSEADAAPAPEPYAMEEDSAPMAEDTAEEDMLPAEDSGVMTASLPAAASALAPVAVFDGAGQAAGHIADADALAALLTGEPWQGEAPEPVYTLTLDGTDYAFAADENGRLLWQRAGGEGFTLSPAALADLQALIVG